MCFAAWTKGTSALLLDIWALSRALGVKHALEAEWGQSIPENNAKKCRIAAGVSKKAWRFAGEMYEIADTFASVGLPDGFHRGAEDLYRRLAPLKGQSPHADEVVDAICERGSTMRDDES